MLPKRFKTVLKVLFACAAVFGTLAILAFVYREELIRRVAIWQMESKLGMPARLDKLEMGAQRPVIRVENFALTNTSDFGSEVFIHVPELHFEIDPHALNKRELRLKEVRLNLAELNIVRDKQGRTNLMEVFKKLEDEVSQGRKKQSRTKEADIKFGGIEKLTVSLGEVRYTDMADPRRNQTFRFGITNHVATNIKDEQELQAVLATLLIKASLRNYFYGPVNTNQPNTSPLDFLLRR